MGKTQVTNSYVRTRKALNSDRKRDHNFLKCDLNILFT